jgi:F-type H+-transporting ATPase subunit c
LPPTFSGKLPLQCEPGCTVSGNHLLAVIHKEAVMKKWSMLLIVTIAVALFAPAAFAQENAGGAAGGGHAALWISAAFGMGIAAFGCGLAQGRIGAAALEGIARNPGAAKNIFTPMLLSLAFVETLVLFTFLMIILKVK